MVYIFIALIIFVVIRRLIEFEQNDKIQKQKYEEEEKFEKELQECGFDLKIENDAIKIYVNEKIKMWTIGCEDKYYKFEDVLSCELLENNSCIINTTSQKHVSLGKALVGDVLFGPVGAIIGGTSGKTTSASHQEEICSNLKIKITLNDFEEPCKFIELINEDILKQSEEYQELFETGQEIVSLFQVLINNK